MIDLSSLFGAAANEAARYRASLADRPVVSGRSLDDVRAAFDLPLPDHGLPPEAVLADLVRAVEPGLVATAGPRFFGFVVGGALPSATAADMLAAGWDQMAFNAASSPAADGGRGGGRRVAQGRCSGLPASASVGFVTGAQAANTVGLAAARHEVLAAGRVGRRARRPVRRAAGAGRRRRRSGTPRSTGRCGCSAWARTSSSRSRADANGAIDVDDLQRVLAARPSRADDRVPAGRQREHRRLRRPAGGMRARAGARRLGARRRRVRAVGGSEPAVPGIWWTASSSPTPGRCDGHKWLNVPYDCGVRVLLAARTCTPPPCRTPRPTS